MHAGIIRLKKEARALFWPWCTVTIIGGLPLVLPHSFTILDISAMDLSWVSLWLGIPVLAAFSLDHEFQCRTLSLWLSQPFSRMQLWRDKLIVSCTAILAVAIVIGIGQVSYFRSHRELILLTVSYVIAIVPSATFWTLLARSTVSGFFSCFVFNYGLLLLFVRGVEFDALKYRLKHSPASTITAMLGLAVCYAVLMLWLGARKLMRFQLTGAAAGDDLMMSGPALMPEPLAEWFRCRPTRPVLNLIRKELRLLRPLWLVTLPALLLLVLLATLRLLPHLSEEAPLDFARLATGTLIFFFLALVVVAGSLSLGEEKTSGTLSWHMSLPISSHRQWLVKLAVAIFAGFVCTVILPLLALIAGGSMHGTPFLYLDAESLQLWLFLVAFAGVASFWCACAVNGTVRSAALFIPVTIAISSATIGGLWLAQELTRGNGTLRDFVVSRFHLNPLAFSFPMVDVTLPTALTLPVDYKASRIFFVPALLFAVIQSYRLFRAPSQQGIVRMLRYFVPLSLVSLLFGFALSGAFLSSKWEPFDETRDALEKLQPAKAKLDLAGDDVAKSAPLSSLTRRWLAGSTVAILRDSSRSSAYRATIHLASGLDCKVTAAHFGALTFSPEKPRCEYPVSK
jgi:ABC-2 family transporter